MNRVSRLFAVAAAGFLASSAQAATSTWGNTATNWNDPLNWVGGQPNSGDTAVFSNTTPAFLPNLTTSTTISNLQFKAGDWTLSSDSPTTTLTLLGTGSGSGAALFLRTNNTTISAPLIFGAASSAQEIGTATGAGTLLISGSITKSDANNLKFSTPGPITVSGNISAGGKVTTAGAGGGLTLSGNNTAGSWDIGSGGITLDSAGALGSSGGINWSDTGLLIFTANNNTDYSSRFTVSADKSYTVGAQSGVTVTLASMLSGNGANSGFRAGGSQTIGTIILGNAGNSFSGPVTVGGGALSVAGIGNAGNNSYLGTNGTINLGASTTAGTLIYTGAGETSDKVINLAGTTGGGRIQADNTNGVLKFTSDFTATGAGKKLLTLQGAGIGEIAGAIVDNSLVNTSSVTKAGSGTWVLSGKNTYSGATAVNGGILVFANTNAKASNTVTAAAGGTIGLGVGGAGYYSASDVDQLYTNTLAGFSMNVGSGVALDTTAGDFTYASNIVSNRALTKLGANTLILTGANTYTNTTTVRAGTLQVGNGGSSGALGSGAVSNFATLAFNRGDTFTNRYRIFGSGDVVQSGSGTLVFTNAAAYTGATRVDAGTLSLQGGSLASSARIASGATLQVTNGTSTIGGAVTNAGVVSVVNASAVFNAPVVNQGAWISDPSTNAFNANYTVGSTGYISAASNDVYAFGADFIMASTNHAFNLASAHVVFGTNGYGLATTTANHLLSVSNSGALNIGQGYTNFSQVASNFAIGTLSIQSGDRLTVAGNKGGGQPTNALYVGWLDIQGAFNTNSYTEVTNAIFLALSLPNINLYYDKYDPRNGWLNANLINDSAAGFNLWGNNGLLLPIPEPSTFLAVGVGLALLTFLRCRKAA